MALLGVCTVGRGTGPLLTLYRARGAPRTTNRFEGESINMRWPWKASLPSAPLRWTAEGP